LKQAVNASKSPDKNAGYSGDVAVWVDPQRKFFYDPDDKNDVERRIQGGYVRRNFKKLETGNDNAFHLNLVD